MRWEPARPEATRVSMTGPLLTSVIGNALEWYDFFLYGTASALVFGQLFFPVGTDPMSGTLAAFAGYGLGFLARPLGGAIFAHIGDRLGRRTALVWTLFLMGLATLLIGLLPTYGSIGLWAPALLVGLRLLQGLAAGGEWGGGVLMLTENAPPQHRGFWGAWSQSGVAAGFLLSAGAFWGAQQLTGSDFLTYGWRIPFLVSVVLFGMGALIRLKVSESQEFTATAEPAESMPLLRTLTEHPREVILGIGIRLAETGGSHLMIVFSLAYGKAVGAPVGTMLLAVSFALLADAVMMPVFGALSDRIGRRLVYGFGVVGMGLFAYPFLLMIASKDALTITLAMVIGNALCHGAMIGVQPALFTEMFPVRLRYSGLALAHEVSSMILGFGPLLATWLFLHFGSPVPVAIYIVTLCVLSLTSLVLSRSRAD